MELGRIYFFTATIRDWIPLLAAKKPKEVILSSLKYLSEKGLIKVYGFIIMPNHIHFIWELIEMNGKEMPHASFLKFTSHRFLKDLKKDNPQFLSRFEVGDQHRSHNFWQRDSLPIEIINPLVVFQKLEYIHHNPCKGKWMLVDDPVDYRFSSYEFYEKGIDRYGFLIHIGERI